MCLETGGGINDNKGVTVRKGEIWCFLICSIIILFAAFFGGAALFLNNKVMSDSKVKIEKVYKAASVLVSATDVGVNYINFNSLVQEYNTQLMMAEDDILRNGSKKDVELIGKFRESYEYYRKSYSEWKRHIEDKKDSHESEVKALWTLGRKAFNDTKDLYYGKSIKK